MTEPKGVAQTNDEKEVEHGWVPVRGICESLKLDYASHRERLLKSSIPRQMSKAKGRDGRVYEMLCIPITEQQAAERLFLSAKRYRKK